MERTSAYEALVGRFRDSMRAEVPAGAIVLVVSKGDTTLLDVAPARGRHFPQTERAKYAGHHPADSAQAVAHLEALKAKGAEFIAFPGTAFWWLQHYVEFRDHLERVGRVVLRTDDCVLFALKKAEPVKTLPGLTAAAAIDWSSSHVGELIEALIPPRAGVIVISPSGKGPLNLHGRTIWSLSQPASALGGSADAEWVAQLEALRQQGASFLFVPYSTSESREWSRRFNECLDARYAVIARPGICRIYTLADEFGRRWRRIGRRQFVPDGHVA